MDIDLKTLVIGTLSDATRSAVTRAAHICVGLGQYEVEVEHLFLGLIEQQNSDFVRIVYQCGISLTCLNADLRNEVSRFRSGGSLTPAFARHLSIVFEHAWLIALAGTVNPSQIRSGHLLLAMLIEPKLKQRALRASPLFAAISLDRTTHDFDNLTRGSDESRPVQVEQGCADLLASWPQRAF